MAASVKVATTAVAMLRQQKHQHAKLQVSRQFPCWLMAGWAYLAAVPSHQCPEVPSATSTGIEETRARDVFDVCQNREHSFTMIPQLPRLTPSVTFCTGEPSSSAP